MAGNVRESRAARLFARYVKLAERRTYTILFVLFALFLGALFMSLKLELHTDMSELLPDHHPAVLAYKRLAGRQKSATNLVMLISSPSEAANRKFAEALRPELQKMIPKTFTDIQWRPNTEIPEYAAKWKWLYADQKDLENAEDLLDRIISKRSSPLAVDLEGDPEKELKDLRERLNQKLPPRKDTPYFEMEDHGTHWLGIMLWRGMNGIATRGDIDTLNDVKALVARTDPAHFDAKLKVGYTGGIAEAIDEQNGIRADLTVATILCSTLVLLAIFLYFRRMALILVIGAPAVLGLLFALTIASLTIHYLNISTAFLISIILGNGINAPIILLARYGEERRREGEVSSSLVIAMSETLMGTLTAMTAASIAYGSLLITSFRGFNQFGLLGGAGMLLVWIVSFLLVPPLVIAGERIRPGLLTPRGNLWRRPFAWLGRAAERRPGLLALLSLGLVVVAVLPLKRYLQDPLEWNINNLRDVVDTPSQHLWTRMEKLGMGDVSAGYIGNNAVMLVDRPDQADAVAEALRKQDAAKGKLHVLKAVRTIHSMLPKDQAEKLEILGRIRHQIDRHHDLMDPSEQKEADAWRPPNYLRPLTVNDLPTQIKDAFTETDGQRGRLIGIDADHTNYSDWNGHDLLRMDKALKVKALGQTWVAASTATIFAGMLESILADGPRVTVCALVGVVLLVLIAFGPKGGLPVLISLGIGIAWLGGLLGHFHLKINFMNFVALPITLGVGCDYAANIWARMREGGESISTVIADTGSAVALCSLTTVIGYSSLLMSHNRALRSFGMVADLGELTCLAAAVIALPALVQLLRRGRGTR